MGGAVLAVADADPPRFAEGGVPYGIAAIGMTRCVEIPLAAPLGGRAVIDGLTRAPPDEIDPFDTYTYQAWAAVMALDVDSVVCVPKP